MAGLSKAEQAAKVSKYAVGLRREVALTEKREMETAKMKGDLLDRGASVRLWSEACIRLRTRLRAIPDRTAATLAGSTEADIRNLLMTEIDFALEELAAGTTGD